MKDVKKSIKKRRSVEIRDDWKGDRKQERIKKGS